MYRTLAGTRLTRRMSLTQWNTWTCMCVCVRSEVAPDNCRIEPFRISKRVPKTFIWEDPEQHVCDDKLRDDDLTRKFHATISAFFEKKCLIWICYGSNMPLSAKLRKFARTEFLVHTAEMLPRSRFWFRDVYWSSAPLWLSSHTQCLAMTTFTNMFWCS